jgi:hypothetical protein
LCYLFLLLGFEISLDKRLLIRQAVDDHSLAVACDASALVATIVDAVHAERVFLKAIRAYHLCVTHGLLVLVIRINVVDPSAEIRCHFFLMLIVGVHKVKVAVTAFGIKVMIFGRVDVRELCS